MTDRLKEIEARHLRESDEYYFDEGEDWSANFSAAHEDRAYLLSLLKRRADGYGVGKLLEDMADAFEHIQSTYSLDLSDGTWLEELKDKARARAADYIEAMGGVPAGWKLVPVEPTEAMLEAAYYEAMAEDAVGVWREMLAASPTPPTEKDKA